jgi:hypothetical protein
MITFVQLGNELIRIPKIGKLLQVERCKPTASDLCFARIAAAKLVDTEYFSIIDGGEDILLDTFEQAHLDMCDKLTETGLDIASAKSQTPVRPDGIYMQHGVVCRTSAFNELILPTSGCFNFIPMVYGMLAKRGVIELDVIVHKWNPTPKGAHSWPDTTYAWTNGRRWVEGKPPIKIPLKYR